MPWNFLILPLTAGYFILTHSAFFKYKSQRLGNQRLVFESIIIAVIISFIGHICKFFLVKFYPEVVYTIITTFSPDRNIPYLLTSIIVFIISIMITWIINVVVFKYDLAKKLIRNAILEIGNDLEKLLFNAHNVQSPVQFTLRNGKVYVGLIKYIPIPRKTKYVTIIPILSGYRNEEYNIVFENDYLKYIEKKKKIFEEGIFEDEIFESGEEDYLELDIVIYEDDIISASYFDEFIYEEISTELPRKFDGWDFA